MEKAVYRTRGEADTAAFGAALAAFLRGGDCVLLNGDLGAGKSVMARGIARALGVTDVMPSPTFTIMQPYKGVLPVYHFDLYRIEDPDEFYEAGLNDYLLSDGISLVEWPQQADLPELNGISVTIERLPDDDERRIALCFTGFADREEVLANALERWRME